MNMKNQDKEKGWLAAEYALGVAEGKKRAEAEKLVETDLTFRRSVDAWQNQLSPMLDEIEEVKPPRMVWDRINQQINPAAVENVSPASGSSVWKWLTTLSSTVAAACLGGLIYVSGGDFTSGTIPELKQKLAAEQGNVASANSAFNDVRARSAELEQQVAGLMSQLGSANADVDAIRSELASAQEELAEVRGRFAQLQDQFDTSRPLVASLTQSGDAPAFVAQFDPLKKSLLIRTAVEDTDEKVPEIWLIPAEGERKGEVLSLGVMDESKPDVVRISDELISLIGEGGTLAITMEPPGGSPTGVATGPVIALGKLQSF